MATYNDGLAAASTYNTAVKPYKRAESVYGGTKSMYNVPLAATADSGPRSPAFDCSKSMYGGIEESSRMEEGRISGSRINGPLKRSLSVHSKVEDLFILFFRKAFLSRLKGQFGGM